MLRVFMNGLGTGLILQLAIGPVFFFILHSAVQRTLADGFCAVIAVTIVDYCYILLAVVGVGKILEQSRIKHGLGILSAVVLFVFGIIMLVSARNILTNPTGSVQHLSNYWSSFLSAFLLTISNPLTIVFWTSLFASKAIEYGYTKRQLMIFGGAAGLATLVFLGSMVVIFSLVKTAIPLVLVKVLNALVGVVLMIYGIIRGASVLKQATPERVGEMGE